MRPMVLTILFALLTLPLPGAENPSDGGRTFTHRVVKAPSVVYLKGFHSATQRGPTCNVYSAWMILRYYKYRIHPTQIKRDADGGEYKTSKYIEEKMAEYGFTFLYYAPKQDGDFADVVKLCIDLGIPLQWGVNLKYAPGVPRSRRNSRDAGHARVIWGYERDRRTGEVTKIIYGDSWGRDNLRRKVAVDEARHMTMDMHPIFPKDTSPAVVAKLLAVPGMRKGTAAPRAKDRKRKK